MKPELIPVFRDMKHLHCSTPVGVDMYIVATLPTSFALLSFNGDSSTSPGYTQ